MNANLLAIVLREVLLQAIVQSINNTYQMDSVNI